MMTRKFHYPTQYDSLEALMNRKRLVALLKSKAVWGAIFAAGAWTLEQPAIDAQVILQAGGAVLSAAGIRDAITKLGAK